MERTPWETIITFVSIEAYPVLTCPYCSQSSLVLEKDRLEYRPMPTSFRNDHISNEMEGNIKSVSSIYHENKFFGVLAGLALVIEKGIYNPGKFVGFFKCDSCEHDVSVTGTAQLPFQSNQSNNKVPKIKVEYFSPAIPVFKINENIPKSIQDEMLQAFNHYHSDVSSSGAKLRRAIEKLCGELGCEGRNLHRRIENLGEKFPKESKWLSSIKLLGNEASHSDSVNESDLLDAFEVFEVVLKLFERIKNERDAEKLMLKLDDKFKK